MTVSDPVQPSRFRRGWILRISLGRWGMLHAPGGGLLHILWRRKLIILICLLLSAGGAFAYIEAGQRGYLEMARPMYMSSSRIYIRQSGPKIMSSDEGDDQPSGNYLNNECQIMRSGPILSTALDAPGIRDIRTFAGAESPISILAEGLSIAPGKSDDLITVSFESYYPEDTAAVTNAVVDAYVAHQSTRKRNTAAEVLTILQKEKVKRDGEIELTLKALLEFKRLHSELGFQGKKGNTIIQKLDRLSTALTEAELQLIDANADYQSVMSMKNDPGKIRQFFEVKRAMGGFFVSMEGEASRLQAELTALRLQDAALKRQYPTSQPAIQLSEKRIADVISMIQEHEKALAATQFVVIQQRYKVALEKHERTKAAYDEQLQAATGLNSVMAEYERLENAWQKASKLAEVVDQRIRELNVTEDVGALNISVLEPAVRPNSPFQPEPLRVVAIAVALGVLAGVGLALFRGRRDQRLHSEEEMASVSGLPVVGVVPKIKGKKGPIGQAVLWSPESPAADACRRIDATLAFGTPGADQKTILVTSPEDEDGRSTFVSNLGITMAKAGRRVVIVDADFRHPSQHEILQVAGDKGLSSVLTGKDSLEDSIQKGPVAGLDVITAGPEVSNSYDILGNHRQALSDLLAKLADRYDHILVDSPPVTSAADALALAGLCKTTLLVLRADRSRRNAVEQAVRRLNGVSASIRGIVIVCAPTGRRRHDWPSL